MLFLTTSCTTLTPHENFKGHMTHAVGQRIGVALWSKAYYKPITTKRLQDGNMENEYEFRGTCRYFFEFDPKTQIIVGWRFTGSEEDCVIGP